MNRSTYWRLSLMMFLQYAVWGAWLPLAARYLSASAANGGLGFTGWQIGMILGLAGSIGAAAAPFIAGQVADRHLSTERCLAVLLFLGGLVKYYTALQTDYMSWLWLSIVYSVVYMPTLALTNSLAMAHVEDEDRDFPKVRVWGTIGWIVASWLFAMIWLQRDLQWQWLPPFLAGAEMEHVTARLVDSLKFAGVASILYAIYCLTLPHTPPARESADKLAFAKAFALCRHSSFATLMIASLLISIIHQVYFLQTAPFFSSLGLADSQIGPAMTIGQFSEIAVMAFLGLMLKRIGFRRVIFLGCMAYFVRYAVFGCVSLPVWLIVASQALHGICYACFFAAAYIYVDRIAEADVRHSAQTVFGIVILGGGPVLGGFLSGYLESLFKPENGSLDFSRFWYVLAAVGPVTGIFFLALFRDQTQNQGAAA